MSQENKIRLRKSYSFWLNIVKSVDSPARAETICEDIYRQMDDRMLFSTQQQATWDKESMDLALGDFTEAWSKFKKL